MVCQGDASLPVPLCYAWAGLKGRMLKDKPVWKEARWRALESHGGHITLIGESRDNMRGGWVFAAVTFAEVLYSKHIIINLIYTPERLSLQSVMRRDGREHRYTSIDGFGSQFMPMLPKSFHRCNNNSKTQKNPKIPLSTKESLNGLKKQMYYLTSSMLQNCSHQNSTYWLKNST